jgi:hypothetical protein
MDFFVSFCFAVAAPAAILFTPSQSIADEAVSCERACNE